MAAAPSYRRGEVIARRYQVVNKSGETALWVGYYACDQGATSHPLIEQRQSIPEPDVLVKVVKPELVPEPAMREKLVRDLQRVRGLQHPGMPRLMDVQILEEHGTVVLSEAIQAGLSQGVVLRRMVTFRQKERFSLAEVRQIGAQLAHALSYIHGQSYLHGQLLCHGDLRLESVLLRPDGAKLCDIGLGAALPRSLYLEAVKKAGEFELLAPEVRAGGQPVPRSDVFGLAALYRHLLSVGQGGGWEAVLAEKPAMEAVLTRAMHEDPAQRYASIEALIADIESVALTGAPIRRRLAPTPLAMAVAAGRLPVEELNRSVEDLMPDSSRSRRNSGILDAGTVLPPLSSSTSARMSIGTIPPQLGGQNSSRSGRLPEGPSSDSNPSASSRDNAVPVSAKGPTSSTSKGPSSGISRGPTSSTSRGATSATSRGPASGVSRNDTPPGRSAPAEGTEAVASPAAAVVAEVKVATPAAVSAALPGGTAGPGDETTPYRKSTPLRDPLRTTGAPLRDPLRTTGAPLAVPVVTPVATPVAVPVAAFPESATKSGPTELASDPNQLRTTSDSGDASKSQKLLLPDNLRDSRGPVSSRSNGALPRPRGESASQRSRGEQSAPRARSTESIGRVPPPPVNLLITSRLALVGALVLAALVGALVAVVVMLLLRPASLLAPTPRPPPVVPDKVPPPAPVEPVPVVSTPVVPVESDPLADPVPVKDPATATAPTPSPTPSPAKAAAGALAPVVPTPTSTSAPVIPTPIPVTPAGPPRDVPPLRLANDAADPRTAAPQNTSPPLKAGQPGTKSKPGLRGPVRKPNKPQAQGARKS